MTRVFSVKTGRSLIHAMLPSFMLHICLTLEGRTMTYPAVPDVLTSHHSLTGLHEDLPHRIRMHPLRCDAGLLIRIHTKTVRV